MLVDMLACSQALDKSAERLWVANCDITDFQNGRATLVFEHRSGNKGTPLDVVGRVIYGKKLMTEADCENERQRYWWNKYKIPCVYIVGRLRDEEGHPGAQALAAEIRTAKKYREPMILGASIEGKTIDSDGGQLKYTVARDCALTFKPANKTCEGAEEVTPDMLKSEGAQSVAAGIVLDADFSIELPADLIKTYEAGASDAAPSSGVQGDALALAEPNPRLESLVLELRRGIAEQFPSEAASPALWPHGPEIKSFSVPAGDGQSLMMGRVMLMGGHLHHLEDYHGLLGRLLPEGELDEAGHQRLRALDGLQRLQVESDYPAQDSSPVQDSPPNETSVAADGGQQNVPPEPFEDLPPAAPMPTPVEAYLYRRAGAAHDVMLEVSGDQAYADGSPIPGSLVELMLQNVEIGAATLIRAGLKKSEEPDDLNKAMMEPATMVQHIRAAEARGDLPPGTAEATTHHVYNDRMVNDIPLGNAYAYQEFLSRPRAGVLLALDMNDMRAINTAHGHPGGNEAIRAYFHAIRGAVDEAVGRKEAKLFRAPEEHDAWRAGGDEGQVHVPSYEHALRFAHALRGRLEALPPIGGTHKISTSIGMGASPEDADRALYHAKANKKTKDGTPRYAEGAVPNFMHSLLPGHEGPIQLHREAPPSVPTPAAATAGAPSPVVG